MSLMTDAPEGLLQAMLETSPAGISIVMIDGRRLYANPKFAELYGFADVDAAIGGETKSTYLHEEDYERANALLARDGELSAFEVRQLRRDGTPWWCLLDKRSIRHGDQDAYISWHYDITDRKTAEQEAVEKAKLLELTLANIDQGIIVRDADDKILLFNDKLSEMLRIPAEYYERGASTEELNRVHARQGDVMMTPGSEERREEWERRRRAGLPVERLEYERRNAAGEWHFCVRAPMPNGLEVRTFLDITERKRAEQEAIDKARILQTTLESMGQGLTMYDADWNLVSYNSRYRDHFDLPADVFQADSTFDDVVGATMRGDYGDDWRERLTVVRDPTRMTSEWRRSFTRPSGRSIDLLSIPVPSGGFIVTSTDISDIKRVEAELLRQQEINQTVLDAMDQGLLMVDGEGRCQLYNNRVCELINVSPEFLAAKPLHRDLIGMQVDRGDYRHVSREERNRLIGLMRKLETDREPFVYERDIADGRIMEIRNNPLPEGGWVRVFTDVTDRKQAERDIAEKTRQLQLTLDSMEQGIILIDEQDRTVFHNAKAADMLGVPVELLSQGITVTDSAAYQAEHGEYSKIDPETRAIVERIIAERKNGVIKPFSYERQKPDGRWVDVTDIPLEGGGSVRTFLDVTARRTAEQAFAEKTRQLELTLESMEQGIILLDENARTSLYNAKAARLFGVPEEMLARGANSHELFAYQSDHGEFDAIDPGPQKIHRPPDSRPDGGAANPVLAGTAPARWLVDPGEQHSGRWRWHAPHDPRHYPAQARRGRIEGSARRGGGGDPGQERVPRGDEPRDPHADERGCRHDRGAGAVRSG